MRIRRDSPRPANQIVSFLFLYYRDADNPVGGRGLAIIWCQRLEQIQTLGYLPNYGKRARQLGRFTKRYNHLSASLFLVWARALE